MVKYKKLQETPKPVSKALDKFNVLTPNDRKYFLDIIGGSISTSQIIDYIGGRKLTSDEYFHLGNRLGRGKIVPYLISGLDANKATNITLVLFNTLDSDSRLKAILTIHQNLTSEERIEYIKKIPLEYAADFAKIAKETYEKMLREKQDVISHLESNLKEIQEYIEKTEKDIKTLTDERNSLRGKVAELESPAMDYHVMLARTQQVLEETKQSSLSFKEEEIRLLERIGNKDKEIEGHIYTIYGLENDLQLHKPLALSLADNWKDLEALLTTNDIQQIIGSREKIYQKLRPAMETYYKAITPEEKDKKDVILEGKPPEATVQ